MKPALEPGMAFEFTYTVPVEKTVPYLFPEFPEGGRMPEVLATGFLVGLLEFACIRFINPHIDWPRQQTVGIQVNRPARAGGRPQAHVRPRCQRRCGFHLPGDPRAFYHRRGQIQCGRGPEESDSMIVGDEGAIICIISTIPAAVPDRREDGGTRRAPQPVSAQGYFIGAALLPHLYHQNVQRGVGFFQALVLLPQPVFFKAFLAKHPTLWRSEPSGSGHLWVGAACMRGSLH